MPLLNLRTRSGRLGLALFLLLTLSVPWVHAEDWDPIDPFHLKLQEPRIDKAADAEILFWRTKIEDRVQGTSITLVRTQYARIKIFTERGRESQSTIDLLQVGRGSVSGLKARTIKPNGQIVALEKDSIFEREVLKVSGLKVRKFSFSIPSVEVGDIIEYRWTEYLEHQSANYLAVDVQRALPTWRLVVQLKPIDWGQWGIRWIMKSRQFQCQTSGWKQAGAGLYQTEFNDLPAFEEEPWGPPEDQLRAWMLIYYEEPENPEPKKFWQKYGKEMYANYKRDTKVDDKIRELAAEVTTGQTSDEAKLEALAKFCKTKIKNIRHPLSGISSADLKGWKPAEKPSKTVESGMGTGGDINQLFVALANAAGYDARVARMVGKDQYFFEPSFTNPYFLNRDSVAVSVKGQWRFFDLSDPFVESGMLSWPEEGVQALICDPKEPLFVPTPISDPERNLSKRIGHFELLEDGTLEGTVEVVLTGHIGARRKYSLTSRTDAERVDEVKEEVTNRYDTAELSDVEVLHVTDLEKPLTYKYKVSVPGYAQRTGKRIFLVPSFFSRNYQARFRTSERQYPIVFPYGWADVDEVHIRLPEGYELDNADAPAPLKFGDVGGYSVALSTRGSGPEKTLVLRRQLLFGKNGGLVYPVDAYAPIKQAFEYVSKSDNHAITLKSTDGAAGGQ
jgi:hypothetical protein